MLESRIHVNLEVESVCEQTHIEVVKMCVWLFVCLTRNPIRLKYDFCLSLLTFSLNFVDFSHISFVKQSDLDCGDNIKRDISRDHHVKARYGVIYSVPLNKERHRPWLLL